jgi:hypothetical protein
MRTPAGFECPYFYGNYFRGRQVEECRLLKETDPSHEWKPSLCRNCPVPAIVRANSCPNMVLKARVEGYFLGLKEKVQVIPYCTKTNQVVKVPEVGCGQCHPIPDVFLEDSK